MNHPQDNDLRDDDANEYNVAADGDRPDIGPEFGRRLSAFGKSPQDSDPGEDAFPKPLRGARIVRGDSRNDVFKIS